MPAAAFWQWFEGAAAGLAENPDDEALVAELDRRINAAWPEISWEFGPDGDEGRYLALSPNLNPEFVSVAVNAIKSAPAIPGWTFLSYRPRKLWNGAFAIPTSTGVVNCDASQWQFVTHQANPGRYDVIIVAREAGLLNDDDQWQAAAIALEGCLGEHAVIEHIGDFSMVQHVREEFAKDVRPFFLLGEALGL